MAYTVHSFYEINTFTEIKCPLLQQPLNGRVVRNGRSVGDQASFTCNTGYTLVGPQSITCNRLEDTGVWSDNAPSCTSK